MIAEQLRKSILQAAIQGKLTEQLPEDGDARDLLKEIQKEKARLIKEGKIKKEKPLPEITEDEIPFEIPDNWCWVRLGSITYNHGQKKPDSEFTYIDISSIDNTANTLCDLNNILKPEEAPSRARKIVHKGDVIYATVRPYLHNVCMIDKEITPEPIVSTGFAVVCTPMPILNNYLFKCFLSPMFDKYANDNDNSKGVAYPAINDDKFSKALIPLPPQKEQQRIVDRLEQILPELDKLYQYEAKLEALQKAFPKKMKDSILQYAIQGKLTEQIPEDGDARDLLKEIEKEKARLIKEGKIKKEKPLPEITEDEIPFEIPDNWCWVRLGELCSIITDGTHKTPNYVEKGIPFLSVQNISSGKFDLSKIKYITKEEHEKLVKRCNPEYGDLLFCRIGTLGKPIINTLNFEFSIFVSLALIKTIIKKLANYLVKYLCSPGMEEWIDKNKIGGGTHTNKINLRDLSLVPIPLPPLAEQQRIVERLDELLPLCETLE
jgi:type I restriction enzyme S subunit